MNARRPRSCKKKTPVSNAVRLPEPTPKERAYLSKIINTAFTQGLSAGRASSLLTRLGIYGQLHKVGWHCEAALAIVWASRLPRLKNQYKRIAEYTGYSVQAVRKAAKRLDKIGLTVILVDGRYDPESETRTQPVRTFAAIHQPGVLAEVMANIVRVAEAEAEEKRQKKSRSCPKKRQGDASRVAHDATGVTQVATPVTPACYSGLQLRSEVKGTTKVISKGTTAPPCPVFGQGSAHGAPAPGPGPSAPRPATTRGATADAEMPPATKVRPAQNFMPSSRPINLPRPAAAPVDADAALRAAFDSVPDAAAWSPPTADDLAVMVAAMKQVAPTAIRAEHVWHSVAERLIVIGVTPKAVVRFAAVYLAREGHDPAPEFCRFMHQSFGH